MCAALTQEDPTFVDKCAARSLARAAHLRNCPALDLVLAAQICKIVSRVRRKHQLGKCGALDESAAHAPGQVRRTRQGKCGALGEKVCSPRAPQAPKSSTHVAFVARVGKTSRAPHLGNACGARVIVACAALVQRVRRTWASGPEGPAPGAHLRCSRRTCPGLGPQKPVLVDSTRTPGEIVQY